MERQFGKIYGSEILRVWNGPIRGFGWVSVFQKLLGVSEKFRAFGKVAGQILNSEIVSDFGNSFGQHLYIEH